jgi:hypothetical protein
MFIKVIPGYYPKIYLDLQVIRRASQPLGHSDPFPQ